MELSQLFLNQFFKLYLHIKKKSIKKIKEKNYYHQKLKLKKNLMKQFQKNKKLIQNIHISMRIFQVKNRKKILYFFKVSRIFNAT